jgi:hypothetical protein
MENPEIIIESFLGKIQEYGTTTFELSKLKMLETITTIVTSLASRLIVLLFMSTFVLILNIGIALYLGELLGRTCYGFFIVSGFYLIAGTVLQLFRRKLIRKPLSDHIINQALQ